ncbi:putative baseplate assembly protein [Halomonas sp. BM-2019]|uniref:putative baseplate assembly protein n=1 Tax=Halomonas sp. BM-2019 TaxID=2811227 RepID=UPI001B3C3A16|nr:MAG: putative baseplate assembly protein [Halomonas sp. BM-2019]
MNTDPTCGCCEGIEPVTPRTIHNRQGLSEIAARVGTHADFLATMIARLTHHELPNGTRPLQRLSTREPSDPSIALLDAWAVVADVLTFYQERIANEGYLATATERRSILELGRLVGYRLRPGVAASVYLAFTLEDGYEVTIPAGTLARSLPASGENAEPFETFEALEARADWNTLPVRLSQPYVLFPPSPGFTGTMTGFLAGTETGLEASQMILVVGPGALLPYVLRSVEPDAESQLTRIAFAEKRALHTTAFTGLKETAERSPLALLGDVVKALRRPPSDQPASRFQLGRDPARTYSTSANLGPKLLAEFAPTLRGQLFTAYANAPVTGSRPEERYGIEALRVSAVPFGATAPLEFIYGRDGAVSRREWLLAERRSSLSVAARATLAGDASLDRAFEEAVNLSEGEAAPLELTIRVWDPMTAAREVILGLDQLAETDGGRGIRRWREGFDGVNLEVEALYHVADDGTGRLRTVRVNWRQAGGGGEESRWFVFGHAFVIDSEFSGAVEAAAANTGLVVQFDFIVGGISPTPEPAQFTGGNGSQVTVQIDAAATVLTVVRSESRFAGTPEATRILAFDAEYPGVVPGSRLMVDGPMQGCHVYGVLDVRSVVRSDYGLSQRVTLALLDQPWLSGAEATLADIRPVTIHAQNEPLELAEEPLTEDLKGVEVELGGLYEGLEAGRWVAVSGERTDVLTTDGTPVEGVEGTELAMLAGIEHLTAQIVDPQGNRIDLPGDTLHTRLTFAEPLAYTYKRHTAAVNANVVLATHGETVRETIGSGDSAARMQTFALSRSPLTHISAPTPAGTENTLALRVNHILWQQAESLLALAPLDRGYQIATNNEGTTAVTFGDGLRGARVPSGSENVTATYRVGIGSPGNVDAEQITTLGPKPLGVKEVMNPRRASGGADPETRDQARPRVPLATRALDRLVSVDDYTDFATLYAGIDKALAARLTDGRREVVHLTLAGAADAPIDPQSALWRNLMTSLTRFGDPSVPVVLAPREAAFVFLSAKVRVQTDHLWENVEPPLRQRLFEAFGFEARGLGQPLRLSQVVAVMQSATGVDYVDVDLFEAVYEKDAETPETLAARLAEFAARPEAALASAYLPAALARRENGELRPAQVVYLNPALADALILTEVTL